MAKQTITPGSAPIVWSTVEDAFAKINANFTELYASVGGEGIEFDALESSLIPAQNDTYDLGTPQKRWSSVYISDTLSIGGAAITNEGLTVDLPSGTTVAGQLIIDPDKAFFKEFSVNSETSVVADQFNDVLDFNAGTGIQLSVTSTNDQINITNVGVTSLVAGTGMSVSGSTGAVTVTNAGVRSAVAGLGVSVSSSTGTVTFANSGIVEIDSGNITNLTVSARDPVTGKVTITNTAPAGNAYRIVSVVNSAGSIENTLNANSTGATIILQEGTGINLIGTTTPNKVVFENSGVTSLIGGNGITVSSSTGTVTVSIGRGDLIGSVFADDSTILVDGTNGVLRGTLIGNLTGNVTGNTAGVHTGNVSGNVTGNVSGNVTGNVTGNVVGNLDGDVTGSVFSDSSTMLIDGTEGKVVGVVETTTVTASSYIQTATYADLTAIAAAIPTAVKGMIVFDDGTNQFRGFDGSSWVALN
jgi:hypothetical protein